MSKSKIVYSSDLWIFKNLQLFKFGKIQKQILKFDLLPVTHWSKYYEDEKKCNIFVSLDQCVICHQNKKKAKAYKMQTVININL